MDVELSSFPARPAFPSSRPPTSSDPTSASIADDDPFTSHENESNLPPADGGRAAWLFLTACFMVEALIWGFAFTFGIFQDYYSTHEPFAGSGNIAVVGTCAMGIIYISAPLVFAALHASPLLKRWATTAGLIIMCMSLGLSSLARTPLHLVLSQGIGYAVGASLTYAPTIVFMDEWFVRRKGLAFGIMWAGTGISGVVLPLLIQSLLTKYGHATTLRVWTLVLFIMAGPLLRFVRPRLPIAATTRARPFDLSFLWSPIFSFYQLGNVAESLGYFLPTIYLPTYARTTLGAGSIAASLTVVLFNVASVVGCVAMGSLVDKYHATTCILVSTIGSTLGIFFVWGFALEMAPLYVFCVLYGLFAGSFTSTWPAIMREIQGKFRSADGTMVFGFLAAGRGIGNVVSGPLSETLIRNSPWKDAAGWGYGSGYGTLIVFTGVTALLGGLSIIARPMKLL